MTPNLQPLDAAEALDWYLQDRSEELSESTKKSHRRRIGTFVTWCGTAGIENLHDLSGRYFSQYKIWRKEEYGNPNDVTSNTQLQTVRVFVKWCEGVDAVTLGLHEYVDPPRMAPDEDVRTVTLESDTAADVLRFLRTHR